MQRCSLGLAILFLLLSSLSSAEEPEKVHPRGRARINDVPKSFPHRIWAACDFEGQTPDYAWFGPPETKNIPQYLGNATALGVKEKPHQNFAALMTGINPVPGPMMGEENSLYLRYYLKGATEATFQHFSLTSEDNNHIRATDLTEGKWSEGTLHFSRDGLRNDGTPGVPFKEGERMDDLKIFVGKPMDGNDYELLIDDVILFASDPDLPAEKEPFPNRVIFLAAFDTGIDDNSRAKYWPGEMEIITKSKGAPAESYWGVAKAVPPKDAKGKWLRVQIEPPRPVGERTRLRFRYHLTGASQLTVQLFDATVQDNRHIPVKDLKQGKWAFTYLDFTRDSRRNDGSDDALAAGNKVDDLFFFVDNPDAQLFVDEIVLYDARNP